MVKYSRYDIFISHSSQQKELGRVAHYNAIYNGLKSWFDEDLIGYGDQLENVINDGIIFSDKYLLFHSKEAMSKYWVPREMEIAKKKKEANPRFKVLVVKLDDTPLDSWWSQFLYHEWSSSDQVGSILKLLEVIIGKKIISPITASAILSLEPSKLFTNNSKSIAEHSRNYVIYYFSQVKNLLQSVVSNSNNSYHYQTEHHDTLKKILQLDLVEKIPCINGCGIAINAGEFEFIHATRMRVPPVITMPDLPSRYEFLILQNNEISSRILILDSVTKLPVNHGVPFSINFDARLGM